VSPAYSETQRQQGTDINLKGETTGSFAAYFDADEKGNKKRAANLDLRRSKDGLLSWVYHRGSVGS